MAKTIYLIGFMYSGKSTIAKKLCRLYGFEYYDTDQEFENAHSLTISDYIDTFGEKKFRKIEKKILHIISDIKSDKIVATGGGLPCFNDNMDYMLKTGYVIYLEASAEFIAERISRSKAENINKRPLLVSAKILPQNCNFSYLKREDINISAIESLLAKRNKFYKGAHKIVDAENTMALYDEFSFILNYDILN